MEAMKHVFVCGFSRSGTTLLTTILDSHPEISMGYELMQEIPPLPDAIAALERARREAPEQPALYLREDENTHALGTYLIHAEWALVDIEELIAVLRRVNRDEGITDVASPKDQARVALAVVERKREIEGARLSGYKVPTSRFGVFARNFPDSGFVLIVRDPRDVVASQLARKFDRSIQKIATHYRNYVQRFRRFALLHPGHTAMVRYEDLVNDPEPQFTAIFGMLRLDYGDEVRRYWDSKASIHRTRHNNAPSVGRDLFKTSIGRWRDDLDAAQQAEIERICRRQMKRFGYA
jgi:hypothetical protein